MSLCLSIWFRASAPHRVSKIVCRLVACALVSAGVGPALQAGQAIRPLLPPVSGQQKTPTAPKAKIGQPPYLLAIGPTEISVRPVPGPRVRQPPLLPRPAAIEPDPDATAKSLQPGSPARPAEPSAFSPEAPPTLLPDQKSPNVPGPAKSEGPKESALATEARGEPELRDSVIYFETPAGRNGSSVTVPALVPLKSPMSVPAESRATYRKEKE